MYVIKRVDQDGGYVAKPGSKKSYTNNIRNMRKFSTEEQAENELCVENEVVVDLNHIID